MKMVSSLISRLTVLVFGTLYPAYASYKAVKTKNVKEIVKWMMYWIVFALFTCVETITDVLFSWFPFYYEVKIIIVIWLLSPATRGSSILYRKFVHPILASKEQEIDEYIAKAKERSYKQVLDLGSKGVNVLMQTAIKGGGGLVNQIRRSYSLSDLSGSPEEDSSSMDVIDSRITKKKRQSPSGGTSTESSLYFSEVDVRKNILITSVKSNEDISSGYSSGEVLGNQTGVKLREGGLVRSSSLSARPRSMRITRSSTVPKKTNQLTESEEELLQEIQRKSSSSSSDSDFRDCLEGDVYVKNESKTQASSCKDLKLIESKIFRQFLETTSFPRIIRSAENITDLEKSKNIEDKRAGKYNKRTAPLPPPNQHQGENACLQVPVVKATLVLKPGEVIPVGPKNCQNSNIFVCHSPKAKRKSFTRKGLNRLMPKKLIFWHHKSDSDIKKLNKEPIRYSLSVHGSENVKLLSKSDNLLKSNNFSERLSHSSIDSAMGTNND